MGTVMTFTDREAKVLKDAMAILNKYMEPQVEDSLLDYPNEGIYAFEHKNKQQLQFIDGFCQSNGLETKLEYNINFSFDPVLYVKYTTNNEFLQLQKMDVDVRNKP